MRPVLSLLPSLLLLAACGPAAPRTEVSDPAAPAQVVVRLATWNVHDLFDEVDRREPPGALDEVPSPAEVAARLEAVAAVLRRLDADVVLLQEVEDRSLLERLAARAGYPEARLVEGNDPRGIDVALLSRLPVRRYESHAGEREPDGTLRWPRDAVEAEVAAGGRTLVLVGSHLSSHLSDPDGARRARQAAGLRALADAAAAAAPGGLVVVGGDLNDEAAALALAPLLGDGAWRAALPAAGAAAWTWSDGSRRAALDHLALPAGQAEALLAARVEGGADVAAASDHRPVVLDLAVP
jgi:endonuclease/exonuclease/phosphatase family metal-dependent hydrolase